MYPDSFFLIQKYWWQRSFISIRSIGKTLGKINKPVWTWGWNAQTKCMVHTICTFVEKVTDIIRRVHLCTQTSGSHISPLQQENRKEVNESPFSPAHGKSKKRTYIV